MDIEQYIEESNAIEHVYSDEAISKSKEAWEYLKKQDELTQEVIKKTHELIMEDRQPDIAGEYRTVQVFVGNHTPPEPEIAPKKMSEWLEQTDPETKEEVIEEHVKFERIHPFEDGNGRVGRMIAWFQAKQIGEEPPLWKAEEKHQKYYPLFQKGRAVTTQVSDE